MNLTRQKKAKLRNSLLHWYGQNGRALPWRVRPIDRAAGKQPVPYHVWLSEIMCQQTRIQAVLPYFAKFLAKWPDIEALAAADLDAVYQQWAGLGYYARARNLHACARQIVQQGAFPNTEENWLELPGIGPYTAAAIMAILHGAPTNVVDGNVERVMARLFAVTEALPGAKTILRTRAAALVGRRHCGDYAQGLMDLGAMVCTPKSPDCTVCPWQKSCQARARGNPAQYPFRTVKPKRPTRYGTVFVMVHDGHVYLQKRAEKGLLGGMSEVPGTPWLDEKWTLELALSHAPYVANWVQKGEIRHIFSHFSLHLCVQVCDMSHAHDFETGWWARLDDLDNQALPSVMRKALAKGLAV